jgi:hypothetical protein
MRKYWDSLVGWVQTHPAVSGFVAGFVLGWLVG